MDNIEKLLVKSPSGTGSITEAYNQSMYIAESLPDFKLKIRTLEFLCEGEYIPKEQQNSFVAQVKQIRGLLDAIEVDLNDDSDVL